MKVKMTALADITHSRMNRIILLQQDPISPVPVVSVGGPGLHSQSFRVASLCFKQDGSILRVDNIHTLIVPNLLPGKKTVCVGGILFVTDHLRLHLHWRFYALCITAVPIRVNYFGAN